MSSVSDTCEKTTITTKDVRFRLKTYKEDPVPDQLRELAETLAGAQDPAGAALAAGISMDWIAEQGELAAQGSREDLRGGIWRAAETARGLMMLRRTFMRINVPCDRWIVSESQIAEVLLRCARSEYETAVKRMHPRAAWEVFVLWGEGCIPDLDAVAPGAREVVLGYVIRHLREGLAGGSDWSAPHMLKVLGAILPGLDAEAAAALRDAGIPVDADALEHALLVCKTRGYWQHWDGDHYYLFLESVCKTVLADKTIQASEIGATPEEIWREARTWTAAQARRAGDGDYENLHALTTFISESNLGYEPFGLNEDQVARWEHARALECWARAQEGDGQAAFDVVCHCEAKGGRTWEQVTGLPEAAAWAELQTVITQYAGALKQQVEQAANPKWAEPPFEDLKQFTSVVWLANDYFQRHGKPLITLPWEPDRKEWDEFCDRYLED